MSILETIVQAKRVEVDRLPLAQITPDTLRQALEQRSDLRPFRAALEHPRRSPMALIAEVKKASPSAGIIRPDFDPVAIAREYEAAGADCLSVLTDQPFFQGSLAYLQAIRQVVQLPLLRKDFIIDARQILEAAQAGADAILLIAAILDDERLQHFHQLATAGGLAALVEVHDQHELDRALAIDATLIGVNNRDLKSFRVDLATTESLAQALTSTGRLAEPHPVLLVAESGIHTRPDVERLQRCGARAILVGESLMRSGDHIAAKIHELTGANA